MNHQENFHNFNVLLQWIKSFSLPLGIFLQDVSQSRIRDIVERTDLSRGEYVNTPEYRRSYTITGPCPDCRLHTKSPVSPICLDIAWPKGRSLSLQQKYLLFFCMCLTGILASFTVVLIYGLIQSPECMWAPGATWDASGNPTHHTGWLVWLIISRSSLVALGILTQVNKI